ncbi:MAG: hypothetical protein E7660_05570 [Ruminococcaceae bacterium]|nr:hypothetical protein [Oscillospiraceae bacterium]
MNHEKKTDVGHLWHIEYPFFEGEETSRINKYFETLARSAKEFCGSESFPKNTGYYMTYTISFKEDSVKIAVTLALRKRGRFIRRRRLCTEWKNGFIINKEVTDEI